MNEESDYKNVFLLQHLKLIKLKIKVFVPIPSE